MKTALEIDKTPSVPKIGSSRKRTWPLKQTSRPRLSKKRSSRSRRRYNYTESWTKRYLETVISQCIICGIILSSILILRIIQIPETLAVREQISTTIGANIDLTYEARTLGAMLLAVFAPEENALQSPGESFTAPEALPVAGGNESGQNFRIDEDILQSIHNRESEDFLEFRQYRSLP